VELHRGDGHIVCRLGERQLTIRVAEFAARLCTAALSAGSAHGTAQQNTLLVYCWSLVSGSERHLYLGVGGRASLC